MLVYLVRHGETNENRLGIIQGQMDTRLNQAGRDQAITTGLALKDVNFIAAYSSDSSRAADTAAAIVAHHPSCQVILEPGLRERYMGSLSGTKAPARRPLPSDVESSHSMSKRLRAFWINTIIPLAATTPASTTSSEAEPAVLLVSHGATLSKLVRDILLREHNYTPACDISRHGIYNTSVSIVRLGVKRDDKEPGTEGVFPPSTTVIGELIQFASISHLIKQKEIVTENADILEQQGSVAPKK